MPRIKKIQARYFRGIGQNCINIDLNGKSLLLLGENGTGKSSIVDLIEYCFTGNITRNNFSGTDLLSKIKHRQYQDFTPEFLFSGVYKDTEFTINNENFSEYSLLSKKFILRRENLLEFVDGSDKDRGQSILPFLSLNKYAKLEQALKEAKSELEKEFKINEKLLNDSINEIKSNLSVNISLNDSFINDILNHLNNKLEKNGFEKISNINEIENLSTVFEKKIKEIYFCGGKDPQDVAELQSIEFNKNKYFETLLKIDLKPFIDSLNSFKTEFEKFKNEISPTFLKEGKVFIEDKKIKYCPFCEREIDDVEDLIKKLEIKLEISKNYESANENLLSFKNELISTLKKLEESYRAIESNWKTLKIEGNNPCNPQIALFRGLLAEINNVSELELINKIDKIEHIYNELLKISNLKDILDGIIKKKQQDILKNSQHSEIFELNNHIGYLKGKYIGLQQQKNNYQISSRAFEIATVLHKLAENNRKKCCDEILVEIMDEANIIMDKFHPDEKLGITMLKSSTRGIESVLLKTAYNNEPDVVCQIVYSEGHRDTLGIAIFLALMNTTNTGEERSSIVILDDILTSVDSNHRRRVAEYLLNEYSKNHQLIITTHDKLWFKWLIEIQNNTGAKNYFTNKEIYKWSLEDGPYITDCHCGDYEFIKQSLEKDPPLHYEILVPIAGRLLESILQELRFTFRLAVSACKDERYTIGDIWPTFYKKIQESDFKYFYENVAKSDCDLLHNTKILRNWLTHKNFFAEEITSSEADDFIKPIMNLYDKVYCFKCNRFIAYDSINKMIRCRKGCLDYSKSKLEESVLEVAKS